MHTIARKWGNSLGIRIPKIFSDKISIHDGSSLEIEMSDDSLMIKPEKKYSLIDFIKKISNDNLHSEISFGKPEGKEIW